MTSIGPRSEVAAQLHAKQQSTNGTQHAKDIQSLRRMDDNRARMRVATQHRGTNYAYCNRLPHQPQEYSSLGKKLQRPAHLHPAMIRKQALTEDDAREDKRKKRSGGDQEENAQKKPRVKIVRPLRRGSGAGQGGGGDSRRGGSGGAGGGRQGHGQQQEGSRDQRDGGNGGNGEDPAPRDDVAANDHDLSAGALDEVASSFAATGQETQKARAVRDAWGNGLLDNVSRMIAAPFSPFHLCALDQIRNWLVYVRREGQQPTRGISEFRELAITHAAHRSATSGGTGATVSPTPVTQTSKQSSAASPVAGNAPVDASSGTASPAAATRGERLRDARLLTPLVWLNADRPSSSRSIDKGIARLDMQKAVIELYDDAEKTSFSRAGSADSVRQGG